MNKLKMLAAGAALAFALPVQAETLIFATASPPISPMANIVFEDWAQRINDDADGIVEIDIRHGFTMANPGNFYDRVKDGVVPISWGLLVTVGGRFPLTGLLNLPYLVDDAETSSVAFWRLYEEGYLDEEYHDIVPLFLTTFPNSGVHLSAPIPSLDSLHNARVIVGGLTNSGSIQLLGGVPQSTNPADAYEAIQRGTADGRFVPWTAFPAFRMDEITSYHIEAPIGSSVGMVFINREIWNDLSEEAREVIMRHSGEEQSRILGRFFDEENARTRADIAGRDGHEIVSPTEEQSAAWEERLTPVRAGWVESTPGGEAILNRFIELLEEAAAD